MSDRLLRRTQVEEMIGFGRTFIAEKIASGKFPAPLKVGRCVRWKESDIEEWIAQLETKND